MEHKNQQFFEAYVDSEQFDSSGPEKHLLLAILMSAIRDIKCKGTVGRQAEAFFLDQDPEYIFSFKSICDYLSVDPNQVLVVTGLDRILDKK